MVGVVGIGGKPAARSSASSFARAAATAALRSVGIGGMGGIAGIAGAVIPFALLKRAMLSPSFPAPRAAGPNMSTMICSSVSGQLPNSPPGRCGQSCPNARQARVLASASTGSLIRATWTRRRTTGSTSRSQCLRASSTGRSAVTFRASFFPRDW